MLVPVIGDTLDEDNETFTLDLSGAVGATVLDSQVIRRMPLRRPLEDECCWMRRALMET